MISKISTNGNGASDQTDRYRILSIDGGGIRGVFPAAFLARLEEHLSAPIGSYFDLIAGASTGGIIAIGLGLGMKAAEVLRFYEEKGPRIFDQHHHWAINFAVQKARAVRRCFGSKYQSTALEQALREVLGKRLLGESRTRLVIPAWHAETERVYIYKTAHAERLKSDYKQLAYDAAMATAAAPTYLKPHFTSDEVELIDGGVWANNPIGVATVEAIGVLDWPADKLSILSIGTIDSVVARPRGTGTLTYATYIQRLFMAGQSHSAMGAAKNLTGDVHGKRAIWRIEQHAPEGRYKLDSAARIREMKSRANVEAREQLPILERVFFGAPAAPFEPFHRLALPGALPEKSL